MLVLAVVVALWVLAARAAAGPIDEAREARSAQTARIAWADRTDAPDGIDRIDLAIDEDLPDVYERRTRRRALVAPARSARVQHVLAAAPPIGRVIDAAYRAAGLGEDPTPAWRTRSRLSWMIPVIGVRAGQNQSWREVSDPTISRGVGLDLRMSWHLERLLFDPNETRIAMLDVARRREKRRIAQHTIEVYYAWVAARAAVEQAAASRARPEPPDAEGAAPSRTAFEREVRAVLDEAARAAELDALTAGWFSQALANLAE